MFESPALNPVRTPVFQPESSFLPYAKRKTSAAIENGETLGMRKGTEDGIELLEELRKYRPIKREIIRNIDEKIDDEDERDVEGFKKPKELKAQDKEIIEENKETKSFDKDQTKNSFQVNPPIVLEQTIANMNMRHFSPKISIKSNDNENEQPIQPSPQSIAFPSPILHPSPIRPQQSYPSSSQINPMNGYFMQREFCLDSSEPTPMWQQIPTQEIEKLQNAISNSNAEQIQDEKEENRMIGTLTVPERKEKIRKYLEKRKRRIWRKKISYDCRKKMADKRLRIKGRFVTREQACALLGTTAEDLSSNELLKNLVNSNSNCSIVTSAQNMKIRNIQTLFMPPTVRRRELEQKKVIEERKDEKKDLKVEILKSNANEQIVEIKIETLPKKRQTPNSSGSELRQRISLSPSTMENATDNNLVIHELPYIQEPIFTLQRFKVEDHDKKHSKYHIELPKEIQC